MLKGHNMLIINHETMRAIVQEWLDAKLGTDAPLVRSVQDLSWITSPSFRITLQAPQE